MKHGQKVELDKVEKVIVECGLQCGDVSWIHQFGECFLASSFGLVGRTAAAIQPREEVYNLLKTFTKFDQYRRPVVTFYFLYEL